MIVWNHGKTILMITEYKAEKEGPAEEIRKISVGPGQGIELDILNLKSFSPGGVGEEPEEQDDEGYF